MFSVCVLDLWMLCILLRDVFESLNCCLDLCWVACLFEFISMYFSSLWKTVFYQARQLLDISSTASYLLSLLDFFSQQNLLQFWSIELSGICLDSFLIESRFIEKVSVWPIVLDSFSIHWGDFAVDRFSTAHRQIHIYRDLVLDKSRQILDPSSCNFFKLV